MAARYLRFPIGPPLHGLEVNTILRRHLHLSGTVLRRVKWLTDGITGDGTRVTVRYRVQEGQVLSVRLTDPVPTSGTVPTPGPLDIVWEDQDLVVVNKAPGVLVHPGHGHFADTLGNFLMYHYQQTGQECDFHPVHRLDKGTSGLLVVAKHPHAQEQLKQQLHTPQFRRVYLAICDGLPPAPSGTIDAPIGLAPDSRHRAHPPNPGTHGAYRLSPHRGFSLWGGAAGQNCPPCPAFPPAQLYPSHHRGAPGLHPAPARGHGRAAPPHDLRCLP